MILQTGQRTDIPAFYGPWLINRIKAGFVDVRNPYHFSMVKRYPINLEVTDGIAFCTKNPLPFIPLLPHIKNYRQYWHMTITPYGHDIEPHVPHYDKVLDGFKRISEGLNSQSMVWRYDPIIINHEYSFDIHCESFYHMAHALKGYTDTVVVSFLDIFDKVLENYPDARRPERDIQHKMIRECVSIAKSCGMILKTCGEGHTFTQEGANTEGCLTIKDYERAWNVSLRPPKRQPARPECDCYLHGDIGAYDTCSHFCRYCYANTNRHAVNSNRNRHNPASTMLIGELLPTDTLVESNDISWIVPSQESLF